LREDGPLGVCAWDGGVCLCVCVGDEIARLTQLISEIGKRYEGVG
jgi:hypothetical protein